MKRRLRMLVDIAMFCLFVFLMGYQPGSGLYSHGVYGVALFALFLLHHLLNLAWYKGLKKGAYPFERKFFIAVNFMLFAAMLFMAASSVMLAEVVFPIAIVRPSQLGRDLHVASTAAGFVLMAVHLGLHTHGALSGLERKCEKSGGRGLCFLAYGLVLVLGLYCLLDTGLLGKIMLKLSWQEPFEPMWFYFEHAMSVVALCILTHFLLKMRKGR